jgi:hypothetical protein
VNKAIPVREITVHINRRRIPRNRLLFQIVQRADHITADQPIDELMARPQSPIPSR